MFFVTRASDSPEQDVLSNLSKEHHHWQCEECGKRNKPLAKACKGCSGTAPLTVGEALAALKSQHAAGKGGVQLRLGLVNVNIPNLLSNSSSDDEVLAGTAILITKESSKFFGETGKVMCLVSEIVCVSGCVCV